MNLQRIISFFAKNKSDLTNYSYKTSDDNSKTNLKKELRSHPFVDEIYEVNGTKLENLKNILSRELNLDLGRLNNVPDDNQILSLQNIVINIDGRHLKFTVEIVNSFFQSGYTSWCPEIQGCITEGYTKKQSLDNLLWAISEVIVFNDILKLNPFSSPKSPLRNYEKIDFDGGADEFYTYARTMISYKNYSKIYFGKKHLLLKNRNNNIPTLTIPFEDFNELTRYCCNTVVDVFD